ncbi:UvrD-helicase domain-containing protein [Clostridium butyricum]|uniref:UvrD-helicase domain-containing protein n=1 Tax=Clostridium butyricum TaxID=1492 RepID=UPI002ABD7E24|nr:UvrD-helicase domain-containing protein [Clostridium butyricum]
MGANIVENDHIDDHVDDEINQCFDKNNPRCFFTYAGAGSGKTKSLVNSLNYIKQEYGKELSILFKQVAVITYTNAACDEIVRRIDYSPIFFVSTIHSFLWELIRPYQHDIKDWMVNNIKNVIKEKEEQERRGRKNTKTSDDRIKAIESCKKRLEKIDNIQKFIYNPNGQNVGYDSLNHSEVIKIGTQFIQEKETLQKILISKYPILLIDESQDTKKELIDALLTVIKKQKNKIIIGMFGDMMQRVYSDGKSNLENCIPQDWVMPIKVMNHRSAIRIVELANSIRANVDGKQQKPRSDAKPGNIRLFIADSQSDKNKIESEVAKRMSKMTKNIKWEEDKEYKKLILEHHMAAKRFDFFNLFKPLYSNKKLKQSVLDGSMSELKLFSEVILPIVSAYKKNNKFEIAKICNKHCKLLNSKECLQDNYKENIKKVNDAVLEMCKLFDEKNFPSCLDILHNIYKTKLFELTDKEIEILTDYAKGKDEVLDSLQEAFSCSMKEMIKYNQYIEGKSNFDTHQGVKGLEYERVMVIMDDEEAEGFMFSYEKLFGVVEKNNTDIKNEQEGKDNSISRTQRLFYVACTRAKDDLALVAYTKNKEKLEKNVLKSGWFLKSEIEII